ncbi:MAG TPA: hypothetical protein VG844_06965 [Terracidiphilus sp.]|jgi:hypothetical protein|nr:hypothetical protein [Terracidiphilus sp.]
MSIQMRTMRQIFNTAGILSDRRGRRFPVQFNLTETQDFYAEWPGPRFSYGDLRFSPDFDRTMLAELELDSMLWLSAPGFAAQVHLQGEKFTVVRLREDTANLHAAVFIAA